MKKLVRIVRNYSFPDLMRQTPHHSGEWNDFKFTEEPVEESDFLVVLNYPKENISCKIKKGGSVLLVQEPPFERNLYITEYFRYFDYVVSHLNAKEFKNVHPSQAALPWHISRNFDELNSEEKNLTDKREEVSWITSNLNLFPTHQLRLNFIGALQKTDLPFQLFGRGFTPVADKMDVLHHSKYTIAAENYIGEDYFTEKLQDAILSWNIPFYYGCTNLSNYLPKGSFVPINLEESQKSIELISKTLEAKHWHNHLEELAIARKNILNKIQFFPRMATLLSEIKLGKEKVICSIPKNPFQKSIWSKIRSKIGFK